MSLNLTMDTYFHDHRVCFFLVEKPTQDSAGLEAIFEKKKKKIQHGALLDDPLVYKT